MTAPTGELVTLGNGRCWEITTEHGTRIVVALTGSRARWMRLPAEHADGTVNRDPDDWRWQRLFSVRQPGDERQHGQTRSGGPIWRVRLGAPVRLYVGMSQWWTTTSVVSVRELDRSELPQERRRRR